MRYLFLFSLALLACKKERLQLPLENISPNNPYGLNDIIIHNDTLWVAAGDIFIEGGAIYFSADWGHTWGTSQTTPQAALSISNTSIGLVCSAFGNEIYFSSAPDWQSQFLLGWEVWRAVASNSLGRTLAIGGRNFGEGYIQIIDNQSNVGERLFYPHELSGLAFADDQTVIACGYGLVLRSTDSGNTWAPCDVRGDFYQAVVFPSPSIGYIAGQYGSILKSTDGGATWQKLRRSHTTANSQNRYNDIFFLDNDNGWIAGDNGTLLATSNGGEDWQRIDTQSDSDWQAVAADSDYIFLVASDGQALRIERP